MNHDTDQLSALVDGELDHETRDQLLGHLAHCLECRQVVEAERRLKAMLAGLGDPEPQQPLLADVATFVGPGYAVPPRPRRSGPRVATWPEPATIGAAAGFRTVETGVLGSRDAHAARSRRSRYAAGLFSITGAFFTVAFAVGGEPDDEPSPTVTPPVELYTFEHADVATSPLSDPGAMTASFDRGSGSSSVLPER